MSDYRSKILPANIETTKQYINSLIQLKYWLDRDVFECSSMAYDECAEQYFAEMVLELTCLQRCGFLDDENPRFNEKFEKFYNEFFANDLDKEQRILVNAFIEDLFGKLVKKIAKI